MIRPAFTAPARRRLSVIQIPRTTQTRLGSTGDAPPPGIAWSTISASTPDTSDNWMAYKMIEQQYARDTTPGTLQYTPAPMMAAAPAPRPRGPSACNSALFVFGAIGAAAALTYLWKGR